jgi:hypothetical protein
MKQRLFVYALSTDQLKGQSLSVCLQINHSDDENQAYHNTSSKSSAPLIPFLPLESQSALKKWLTRFGEKKHRKE